MHISEIKGTKAIAKLWIPAHEVESGALDQIRNVASLDHVVGLSIMPDVHFGMGATIGSVTATKGMVIPSITGVDIGCGMKAMRTNLTRGTFTKERLEEIRDGILNRIPVGFNSHKSLHKTIKKHPLFDDFSKLIPSVHEYKDRAMHQLGTLGGGNHFIEFAVDKEDRVWIMLHSGSRYIGNAIAKEHIKIAKAQDHNKTGLPDNNLSSLLQGTPEYDQYMYDLLWAQDYATENRARMQLIIMEYLKHQFSFVMFSEQVSCHHNFAQEEQHNGEPVIITRKGAIQAESRQMGIIPGAMGAKSFIVMGKGNKESFNSAPHGAGRKMSRSKAKKTFNFEDLEETMEGIVCNASQSTIDEIRHSYKDIDDVMRYAEDLVTPVYELTQILNIKG